MQNIINDYIKLKSVNKVAKLNGISYNKVYSFLKRENVPMVFKNTKNIKNIPKALEEYKKGYSLNQIHKKYGFDHNVFKRILKENNIEYINRAKNPIKGEINIIKNNLEDILKEYDKNKNVKKTSEIFKIKECNLYRFLKSNNLLKRKQERIDTELEQKIKEQVYDLYINKKMNTADIGKHYGLTRYNIKKILTSNFGESCIRPKEEITREMNYNEEHQKKTLSGLAKKKPYVLPSGKVIGVQGYEDDFLDYVFKNTKIKEEDFDFENRLRIILSKKNTKNKHYYPDFHLKCYNTVIEIKSWYTFNMNIYLNKRKIKKTKEAGYNMIMIKDKNYKKFNTFLKTHDLFI
jgi:uncharacterized protein involved in tolerance to divalent cations